MHNLIQKYRDNELSAEDVGKLRELLDGMSDEELAMLLEDDWRKNGCRAARLPEDIEMRLQRNIHRTAGLYKTRKRMILTAVASCAAVLLCLVAGYAAGRFYTLPGVSHNVSVTANETGGTNVTFPDGSTVTMKPQSEISYSVLPTRDGVRTISFDGVGHFNIAKGCTEPFTISSEMLEVTVLGTEFYLFAASEKNDSRLYLQEGLVKLQSKLSGESVEMLPGMLAVLDCHTGRISVNADSTLVDVFNESDNINLNYKNASLGSVIQSLNINYAPFHITLATPGMEELVFTGNLPGNNLMEALSILEYTANIKISVSNSEITLYN